MSSKNEEEDNGFYRWFSNWMIQTLKTDVYKFNYPDLKDAYHAGYEQALRDNNLFDHTHHHPPGNCNADGCSVCGGRQSHPPFKPKHPPEPPKHNPKPCSYFKFKPRFDDICGRCGFQKREHHAC